jgi:hypothetical protein
MVVPRDPDLSNLLVLLDWRAELRMPHAGKKLPLESALRSGAGLWKARRTTEPSPKGPRSPRGPPVTWREAGQIASGTIAIAPHGHSSAHTPQPLQ